MKKAVQEHFMAVGLQIAQPRTKRRRFEQRGSTVEIGDCEKRRPDPLGMAKAQCRLDFECPTGSHIVNRHVDGHGLTVGAIDNVFLSITRHK